MLLKSLGKELGSDPGNAFLFTQPLLLPLGKIAFPILLFFFLYPYHIAVGNIFSELFLFFRLQDIYKFQMPDPSFFVKMASFGFLGFFIYYSFFWFYESSFGFFSGLWINPQSNILHYSRSNLLSRSIISIPLRDISSVNFHMTGFFRFLGWGNLEINLKSGENYVFKGLGQVKSSWKKIIAILNETTHL